MGLPLGAVAQTALQVKEQRTLSYPRAIGRVEVDREGVLSIAAPSARSLRLTAIGEGAATVSVYGGDGGLMAREPISVAPDAAASAPIVRARSEEHTSELQSLMRISYAVFCLKKKKIRERHKRTIMKS